MWCGRLRTTGRRVLQAHAAPRTSGAFSRSGTGTKRLRASMRRWMTDLFATLDDEDIAPAIGRQIEVGEVHARIRLPVDLISSGIYVLKKGIRRRLDFAPLDMGERMQALVFVSDLLHLADGLMNQAYFRDVQAVVRNDEAYRLVAQRRSSSHERTRQRAALSEWAESLWMAAWEPQQSKVEPLRDSEFGVWMHHKGAVLFNQSHEYRVLIEAIHTMDAKLLPSLAEAKGDRHQADRAIHAIKNQLELIRYQLRELFDQASDQDDGLDHETRLPDRRYLPAILNREMRHHIDSGRSLCLVMIDIRFPTLQGHAADGTRNRLLQQAVETMVEHKRTTDHLFRYDDTRFLWIAVESPRGRVGELATSLMEKLLHRLNTGNIQGHWTPIRPRVAIGIAEFDRHPDYLYFIQRVETALSESAASMGRRVAAA
ncbi:MAG: diguanylate cyclase [Burkholderiaceae bacterium]